MDITPRIETPDSSEFSTSKAKLLQKRMQTSKNLTEQQRHQAKKVSQDFEALFVGMMMKSMRNTVPSKNSLTGGGRGEEVYRSMLDQEYANASTKNNSIGLAKTIEKEIIRHESGRTKPIIDKHE